jgi:hypothetical protein
MIAAAALLRDPPELRKQPTVTNYSRRNFAVGASALVTA